MSAYDLTTEKGMVAWLETLPEDQRRDAAQAVVSRAIARLLPFGLLGRASNSASSSRLALLIEFAICLVQMVSLSDQQTVVHLKTSAGLESLLKRAVGHEDTLRQADVLIGPLALSLRVFLVKDAELPEASALFLSTYVAAYSEADNDAALQVLSQDLTTIEEHGVPKLNTSSLWSDDLGSEVFADSYENALIEMQNDEADWSFWKAWFDGVLRGNALPRALANEITLSSEIDWDNPIAANAKIVEIWKRHQANAAPKPLDPDDLRPQRRAALREQVAFLLKTSDATSLTTRALSQQIKIAIDDWCNDQRCNQLPEDLAVFGQMQTTLAGIADTLENPAPEGDKITALEVRVLELEAENKALLAKLNVATKSPERHPFVLEFHKTMGKLTAGAIYGGAGFVVAQYVGPEQVQALAQAGRSLLEAVKPPQIP